MAEPAYFPSTIIGGIPTLVDGAEFQNGDSALLGQTGGLADDRTLAELFRLTQFTGTVHRFILPYSLSGTPFVPGTVTPTFSANGSVIVNPFRAVIGSRTSVSNNLQQQLQNWRDIRSGIFVGPQGQQVVPLTANSSGNPRWDLVYTTVAIDAPTNQVQRRVKDPSSGAQTIQSVYQYLAQAVSVSVLQGTPAASPSIPAIPADSGTSYNIPLAAVRVVNGFSPTSTVITSDIRDQAPCLPLATSTGATTVRPANSLNDNAGNYPADANFTYPVTSAANRPGLFLPPSFIGGEQLIVHMDASIAGHPSHANTAIIDSSVDWRNRVFCVWAAIGIHPFWSDPSLGSGSINATPNAVDFVVPGTTSGGGGNIIILSMPNSSYYDAFVAANSATLVVGSSGRYSLFPASTAMGIYVGSSDGIMRAYLLGNPGLRMVAWIQASGPLPNR